MVQKETLGLEGQMALLCFIQRKTRCMRYESVWLLLELRVDKSIFLLSFKSVY